jgi:hypothetical protein
MDNQEENKPFSAEDESKEFILYAIESLRNTLGKLLYDDNSDIVPEGYLAELCQVFMHMGLGLEKKLPKKYNRHIDLLTRILPDQLEMFKFDIKKVSQAAMERGVKKEAIPAYLKYFYLEEVHYHFFPEYTNILGKSNTDGTQDNP